MYINKQMFKAHLECMWIQGWFYCRISWCWWVVFLHSHSSVDYLGFVHMFFLITSSVFSVDLIFSDDAELICCVHHRSVMFKSLKRDKWKINFQEYDRKWKWNNLFPKQISLTIQPHLCFWSCFHRRKKYVHKIIFKLKPDLVINMKIILYENDFRWFFFLHVQTIKLTLEK